MISLQTQLLKKEKQKPRDYNPNKYGTGQTNTAHAMATNVKETSHVEREPADLRDLTADLSIGKKEAFEEFRTYFYKDAKQYDTQRNELKETVRIL